MSTESSTHRGFGLLVQVCIWCHSQVVKSIKSPHVHYSVTWNSSKAISHRNPNSWYPQRSIPPPSPNLSNWFPTPKSQGHFPPSYFFLCWRIWTNYLHMCLKEPHGKGAKKNILLTEHKHWLHQTSRAVRSDALHMLTWHRQPFADSTATSRQCGSLSSRATCCLVSAVRRWMEVGHACSYHHWGNMSACRAGFVFRQTFKW